MRKKEITVAQLRALVAVCDNDLNVTAAAVQLQTVQPAVSKKLMSLEKQMGQPMFFRNGKRFQHETDLCRQVVAVARQILLQCDNIEAFVGEQNDKMASGELIIGTTHTQARYVLPPILREFCQEYPNVQVNIIQGSPLELVRLLNGNRVDLVICTEGLEGNSNLRVLPLLPWNRCLIGQSDHPLMKEKTLNLKKLTAHPLVTYVQGFTGRSVFNETFAQAGLSPKIIISAADTDVIKTYVRSGFGCGVIAEMAYSPKQDADLMMRSLGTLFPEMRVRMAYQREKFVSASMQQFIDICRASVTTKHKTVS